MNTHMHGLTGREDMRQEGSAAVHTGGQPSEKRLKLLAEAIILQSAEDLWNPAYRDESLVFFRGEGFRLSAEMAGIGYIRQVNLLRVLSSAADKQRAPECNGRLAAGHR